MYFFYVQYFHFWFKAAKRNHCLRVEKNAVSRTKLTDLEAVWNAEALIQDRKLHIAVYSLSPATWPFQSQIGSCIFYRKNADAMLSCPKEKGASLKGVV